MEKQIKRGRRSDLGKRHKYRMISRYPKQILDGKMFKTVARLLRKHREQGVGSRTAAVTGEALENFREARPSSVEGFSEKQQEYIKYQTFKGGDVKRRIHEEKQRSRGVRWCQPVRKAIAKRKVTNSIAQRQGDQQQGGTER